MLAAILLLGVSTSACAWLQTANGPITYATSAESNYRKGVEAYEDELWQEAIRYFTHVRNKYPFSRYAALAQLHIGDAHRGNGSHLEAIEAYRVFIRFHPSHKRVREAMYRIGLAYFAEIPDEWFLITPPAYERDQASVQDAIEAFEQFLHRFPKGRYVVSAQDYLDECRQRLARHELYVAEFYFDTERYKATRWRLEALLKRYPGIGFDAPALWLMAQAQIAGGEGEQARATLERLLAEHPESDEASGARDLLKGGS